MDVPSLKEGLTIGMVKALCCAFNLKVYSQQSAKNKLTMLKDLKTVRWHGAFRQEIAYNLLDNTTKLRLLFIIKRYGQEVNFFHSWNDWKGFDHAKSRDFAAGAAASPRISLLKKLYDRTVDFQTAQQHFEQLKGSRDGANPWYKCLALSPNGDFDEDFGKRMKKLEEVGVTHDDMPKELRQGAPKTDEEFLKAEGWVKKFWGRVHKDYNRWHSAFTTSGQNDGDCALGFVETFSHPKVKIDKEVQTFVYLLCRMDPSFEEFVSLKQGAPIDSGKPVAVAGNRRSKSASNQRRR